MVKYFDEDGWREGQISSCRKTISLIENHIQSALLDMRDDFDGTKDRYINVLLEAKEKIHLEIIELVKAGEIDIDFDVYSDTPKGKDPDSFSPTLRKYHYILWSKCLPNGKYFLLDLDTPRLLHHKFESGEYFLSSDAITHGYSNVKKMAHIIEQIKPEEVQEFDKICSTIGGYIIFPAKRIDNKMTINGARGCNHKIQDRFDQISDSRMEVSNCMSRNCYQQPEDDESYLQEKHKKYKLLKEEEKLEYSLNDTISTINIQVDSDSENDN